MTTQLDNLIDTLHKLPDQQQEEIATLLLNLISMITSWSAMREPPADDQVINY